MAGMAGMAGLGALPMNPALVAAALNQAGWGLIGNLQGGAAAGGGSEHGGFPTPTSAPFPATVAAGGAAHATTAANSGAPSNGSAGFLGWGASPPGEPGVAPGPGAGAQQTTPPQHGAAAAAAGTWSSQPRDRQGQLGG